MRTAGLTYIKYVRRGRVHDDLAGPSEASRSALRRQREIGRGGRVGTRPEDVTGFRRKGRGGCVPQSARPITVRNLRGHGGDRLVGCWVGEGQFPDKMHLLQASLILVQRRLIVVSITFDH